MPNVIPVELEIIPDKDANGEANPSTVWLFPGALIPPVTELFNYT